MLDLLGTIGGNVLSLPGVLGFALGLLTRNLAVAAILGGLVGVAETLIFADMSFALVEPVELIVAMVVGVLAGLLGSAVRRKGVATKA